METIILVIHLVIVVAMILSILVQRSSSDGLSGLSGGGNTGNALFSVRGKANMLTKVTKYLAIAFILTSLTLAYLATHRGHSSLVDSISTDAKPAAVAPAVPEKKAEPEAPLAN